MTNPADKGFVLDDLAAVLWREEAVDVGAPASIAKGRTREAFDDQLDQAKHTWRKFAKAAYIHLSASPTPVLSGEAGEMVERLNRWHWETANQWSDEYSPRHSWEKQVSDAMKQWGEASDNVTSLISTLQAEVDRCHVRLEIDRVYVGTDDDTFAEQPVPMHERPDFPDGIECRDATITELEQANASLVRERDEALAAVDRWKDTAAAEAEAFEDMKAQNVALKKQLSDMTDDRDAKDFALRNGKSLSEDSIHAIRELLDHHGVPKASFIDDHVGNAIAQRDTAQREVERLSEGPDFATFVQWLRPWVKARFGKWITHNTAKGAHSELVAALKETSNG